MVHLATVSDKRSAGKMQYGRRYGRSRIDKIERDGDIARDPAVTCGGSRLSPFSVAFAEEPLRDRRRTRGAPSRPQPLGMFMNAHVVVSRHGRTVFASLVTWTVCLAKSFEIMQAKRKARGVARLARRHPLERGGRLRFTLPIFARQRLRRSAYPLARWTRTDRRSVLLRGLSALRRCWVANKPWHRPARHYRCDRAVCRPVWYRMGIMNSSIGISKLHTTNLAIVAPGIAEALVATAFGPAAPSAVVIDFVFARLIADIAPACDISAEVLRLLVVISTCWARKPLSTAAE